ncbi:type II secretion system F family protein [uncultured Desulfobacter sp.]|uniref:type II secretion system F family protein n=1 Tax=uncultured Desulfobacter sp. TaxID=240139 RepID=UPI002AA6EC71|nr:type II secretion system F family protein [uncultured Desulfobacter sp.]
MPIDLNTSPKKTVEKPSAKRSFSSGKAIKSKDIVFFLTQLSMMLEVGISLSNAVSTIANQTGNAKFKAALLAMVDHIEEGNQLSDAMAIHPKIFKPVHINIIRSGETGGILNQALDNIIEIQEKNQGVMSQLKTALVYPSVLCVLAILVTIFVLVGILPKFMAFFEGKTDILPLTTQALMAASLILRNYWWACLIGVSAVVALGIYYLKSDVGKSHIDWLLINTPVVAKIANNVYTNLFLRIMGNMLSSNIPLSEALAIAEKSMTNRYYRRFVKTLHDNIEKGSSFAAGFLSNSHIQNSVKQMIFVGEEVGKLPAVMARLVKFYDMEIQQDFKKITSLIEPVALIFMGVVVWIIVSAVILPMFRLAGAIH